MTTPAHANRIAIVRRIAVLVLLLTLVATVSGRADAGSGVVLGSTGSFGPSGIGWGHVAPSTIDDAGDPSGRAWRLRWQHWGSSEATAAGLTSVEAAATPGWVTGRIQLRASWIGRCTANGARAYTRLEVRVAPLKSGAFGTWVLWNGRVNVCRAT